MTNLEQSIKNALPDLMELGVGCVLEAKVEKELYYQIAQIKGKTIQIYEIGDTINLLFEKHEIENIFTVIGKPITLPDVLRWMQKIISEELILRFTVDELLDVWDLTIPNLSNQKQEVKDFLEKLKTDQK